LDAPHPPMKLAALLLSAVAALHAHIGSPDVFFEGDAGPYRLLVTIRPPQVVPGVAEIEIRSLAADVSQIRILPLRLAAAQQFAPVPDLARPTREDPQYYTGTLWLMTTGSWKVRVDVDGGRGKASLSVPVPALSTRVLRMQTAIGAALIPLGLLLVLGLAAIAGAGVREAQLEPGAVPSPARVRRSRLVTAGTTIALGLIVWAGNSWWNAEAAGYSRIVYKPLGVKATLQSPNQLTLELREPGWLNRRTDDLLPDHNHLMHLFVISLPGMDRVWHLHPELDDNGSFRQSLPSMPPGRYALYGDIVHASGIGETVTTQIDLPAIQGSELTGDDAASDPLPVKANYNPVVSSLPGGDRMIWEREGAIHARRPYLFRFRLEQENGGAPADMELYMGMLGHAAFVATDGSVFAHVHPSGSVPMAALELAQPANPHAGHMRMTGSLPAEVSFPYGFPKPGEYRIFVQMKRGGRILTGTFTTTVEN
jgi:hypothetical protein